MNELSACDRAFGHLEPDEGLPVSAGFGISLFQTDRADRRPREDRSAMLARTIESEIIPRLMLAHRADTPFPAMTKPEPGLPALKPSASHVKGFAELVLKGTTGQALNYIERLSAEGIGAESIYLDLLAPAARLLGEMWENDDCHFTDVTIGLYRLQDTLRHLRPLDPDAPRAVTPRVLVAPVPGEQHIFGTLIVEEFLRRAGFEAQSLIPHSDIELIDVLKNCDFDAIGLSAACDSALSHTEMLIQSIRRESRNPRIVVLVGGRAFVDHPDRVERVGAHGVASDGRQAVEKLQELLGIGARAL